MKYFLLKSFNPQVTFDDLVLELHDPNNNSWLINYGINLDINKNYFNLKFYGDENLLKKQSILDIGNVFIINYELREFLKDKINFEKIEYLDFDLYDSNSNKISHDFKIINFNTTVDCINWESSNYDLFDEDEKRYVFYTTVVTQRINKYSFGSIDGQKGIFLNEEIKEKIDEKTFKNLAFKELKIIANDTDSNRSD